MGRECDHTSEIRGQQGGPPATRGRPRTKKKVGCIWCAVRIEASSSRIREIGATARLERLEHRVFSI
jgi:hypothetical protein